MQTGILTDRKKFFRYMRKTSGLLLPLKLISRSLQPDSDANRIIRAGIVQRLEEKLEEVEYIPEEELPTIAAFLDRISAAEPRVVTEVKQIVEKFYPVK